MLLVSGGPPASERCFPSIESNQSNQLASAGRCVSCCCNSPPQTTHQWELASPEYSSVYRIKLNQLSFSRLLIRCNASLGRCCLVCIELTAGMRDWENAGMRIGEWYCALGDGGLGRCWWAVNRPSVGTPLSCNQVRELISHFVNDGEFYCE